MNAVIDAVTAIGATGNVLNAAYAGGADPTGSAACDAAFAACVTAALAGGFPMIIPPGTYKTTGTQNWKGTGLVVRAPGGPDNTTISCTGSNIPVAQFAGNYQDISGLTFAYATPQTSGQTAANIITFGDDTIGSCYQGNYHELNLRNGQTGMAIDPAITTVAGMFSCRIANITVDSCSSSFISLNSNNGLGAANCTGCIFDNIYLGGSGGTVAGFPLFMRGWDEFVFNQLNIEHCTITSQDVLALSVTTNAVFNSLHFEGLTTSLNGGSLLHLNGTTAVINGMSVRLNSFTGSASNPVVNFFSATPATLIINGLNESGNTVTTPSHPLINFGSATNCAVQITGQSGTQTTAKTVNAGAGDYLQLGLPASGGVTPASAFTAFGTGGVSNLLNSTSGSDTTPVIGTWYYAALYIPFNVTLTGFQVATGTVGAVDNWIVALWGAGGGTALANSSLSGIIAPAASTKKAFPFTAPITVTGPAAYIFGLQSNGTTARFHAFPNAVEGFIAGSVAGSFGTVPSLSPASTYTASTGPFASTY